MALETGSKLGHYEILSSLGAGGMGEVYRARDTKLGREVAIKLLLEEVSADPERLARFEREARVLASLNHSNIATLYGFEKEALPAAAKAGVGILAIKVFAGCRGGFASYGGPKVPPQVGEKYMELAIRYSLGLPGVASVNIGVHDPQQVRGNVEMVKNYRPLSSEEHALLAKVGRQMASELGPRFGPATEEEQVAAG